MVVRAPLSFLSSLTGGSGNIRAPLTALSILTGGSGNVRAPLTALTSVTGGSSPNIRGSLAFIQAMTGGNPNVRCPMMATYAVIPEPLDNEVTKALPPFFPTLHNEPQWERKKIPTFNTGLRTAQSGLRAGTALAPEAAWEFGFTYDYLPPSYLATLVQFFESRYGRELTFLYKDPDDWHVVGGYIGTGDNVTYHWPLAAAIMGGPAVPIWQADTTQLATFTSAAISGNVVHVPNHGLTTGQGPLWVSATTVEYGLLPPPLEPGQPYWAIAVDADHFELADTKAHALANTPVTLTSTGSGPFVLTKGIAIYDNGVLVPVSGWTYIAPNQIMFTCPPVAGHTITVDFDYFFICRFMEDAWEFNEFVDKLYELQRLNFYTDAPGVWHPPGQGMQARGIFQAGWDEFPTSITSNNLYQIMDGDAWYFPLKGVLSARTPLSIQTPTRYGYGSRLRLSGSGTQTIAAKITYAPSNAGYLSAALYIPSSNPSTSWPMLFFFDALNNTGQVVVRFEAGGVISAYCNTTLLYSSPAGAWQPNVNFDVEIYTELDSAAGMVVVRVQNLPIGSPPSPVTIPINISGVNTQATSRAIFDSVGFGWESSVGGVTAVDFSIDDMRHYFAPRGYFLGACRVQTLVAAGDGTVLDFSRSNTSLASWQNILNEVIDDTLYLYDPTVGDYTLTTIGPLLDSLIIYWVGIKGSYRQDDATQRFVKNRIESCGYIADGSPNPPAQTYVGFYDIFMTDPHTGNPFTGKSVSALQVGPYVYA